MLRPALMAVMILGLAMSASAATAAAKKPAVKSDTPSSPAAASQALRAAIADLTATFGEEYPRGKEYLARLDAIEKRQAANDAEAGKDFLTLQHEALLANPLLSRQPILFVTRTQYAPDHHSTETMFQTGEINTGKFHGGGVIKTINLAKGGEVKTLLEAPRGVARDVEVDYDGKKILFSMRKDVGDDYHVYEMNADGSGVRQLTTGAGISDIDPAYLPDGRIVFSGTREPKYCHCNRHIMANLYTMDANGGGMRQIGHNTLFEGHSFVMPDGRILYDRWEYVDRHFGPSFGLWTTNPDGTNHQLYFHNNTWSPGAIVDARVIPGTDRVVCTFSSCHDRPWGAIAIVDRSLGLECGDPVLKIWPASARQLLPAAPQLGQSVGSGIDGFKQVQPKYEDPFPLSEKYFLCSRAVKGEEMGIFLLDTFGNEVLVHSESPGCYDPMPLGAHPRPKTLSTHVDLAKKEGLFYLQDVYIGTGMEQVKRGSIKWLRIVEVPQKLFWCNGNWNVDATQAPAMNWNCTNSKKILGDVPVEEDGSAYFAVPADKFIYFQALDKDKMMVQSMRSGTTIMPGERQGCIGCHENRLGPVPGAGVQTVAMRKPPTQIEPWYGPARDFNYFTEVQPVFDKNCVKCHDYGKPGTAKLTLAGDLGLVFNTSYIELRSKSATRWAPEKPGAPKIYVKVVDDGPPDVLPAFAWGSHRSKLIDVVKSGHNNVKMDQESLDRLVTWIDMNAPYYGSYGTAFGDNAFGRSPLNNKQLGELAQLTGVKVGSQALEMKASQVNFTRPELSPCLAGFKDKNDPKYKAALDIILAGQKVLQTQGRGDMPNYKLCEKDQKQLDKREKWLQTEAETRKTSLSE